MIVNNMDEFALTAPYLPDIKECRNRWSKSIHRSWLTLPKSRRTLDVQRPW